MPIRHLSTIIFFYFSWIIFSLALNGIGRWIPSSLTELTSYLFIIVSLLCLSALTASYRKRIEPYLTQAQSYRIGGLIIGLLLFVGVYIFIGKMGVHSHFVTAFHSANLIFMACLLGHWLVIPLKRAAELIPLCLVVSLVDIYSVFKGPSKNMTGGLAHYYTSGQAGTPPLIDFLLIKFPLPDQAGLLPIFGVSDWVIIAMLSAAAAKFELKDNIFGQTNSPFMSVATIGLLLSIVLARTAGLYLPALPLIALIFLAIMLARYAEIRHITRNELHPLGLFCFLAAALFVFAIKR
jgi:hypothetical protein